MGCDPVEIVGQVSPSLRLHTSLVLADKGFGSVGKIWGSGCIRLMGHLLRVAHPAVRIALEGSFSPIGPMYSGGGTQSDLRFAAQVKTQFLGDDKT